MTPADAVPWHLDAGAVSLDLVYSRGAGTTAGTDALQSPADLDAWLVEHVAASASGATARDLADALTLRDALARLYDIAADDGELPADDVDTLNLFAATPDVPPALDGGRRQAGAARIRTAQALSTLARDAVAVLGARAEARIRRCADPSCRLVFVDESRTNSRRWCSMQRCGNRAKVRAHRERVAAARG